MNSKHLNPVLDIINTLCNFIVLNLVFLLTCIPIITIGTALSSLYYVTLKEARGEYGYLVRTYIKEFIRNLKYGTLAFLILFVIGNILFFNIFFWNTLETIPSMIITGLLLVAGIVYVLIFTYTFPLIGRFENTTRQSLKNALAIALSNAKATLALIIIDAIAIFFCMFLEPMKLLMVLFGFAFIAYCHSFILNKVFEPFEQESL